MKNVAGIAVSSETVGNYLLNTMDKSSFHQKVDTIPGEDTPMTYQLVLFGDDGVVVASDRRAVSFDSKASAQFDEENKIIPFSDMVYTFAGDSHSKEIGKRVAERAGTATGITKGLIDQVIAEVSDEQFHTNPIKSTYRKIMWIHQDGSGFRVWRAVSPHYEHDFKVDFVHSSGRESKPSLNPLIAGDERNRARYIVDQFFDRMKPKSVAKLKRLAAYTVLTAQRFNPEYIHGLQMFVWDSDGLREIEDTARLAAIYDDIEKHINGSTSSLACT